MGLGFKESMDGAWEGELVELVTIVGNHGTRAQEVGGGMEEGLGGMDVKEAYVEALMGELVLERGACKVGSELVGLDMGDDGVVELVEVGDAGCVFYEVKIIQALPNVLGGALFDIDIVACMDDEVVEVAVFDLHTPHLDGQAMLLLRLVGKRFEKGRWHIVVAGGCSEARQTPSKLGCTCLRGGWGRRCRQGYGTFFDQGAMQCPHRVPRGGPEHGTHSHRRRRQIHRTRWTQWPLRCRGLSREVEATPCTCGGSGRLGVGRRIGCTGANGGHDGSTPAPAKGGAHLVLTQQLGRAPWGTRRQSAGNTAVLARRASAAR